MLREYLKEWEEWNQKLFQGIEASEQDVPFIPAVAPSPATGSLQTRGSEPPTPIQWQFLPDIP